MVFSCISSLYISSARQLLSSQYLIKDIIKTWLFDTIHEKKGWQSSIFFLFRILHIMPLIAIKNYTLTSRNLLWGCGDQLNPTACQLHRSQFRPLVNFSAHNKPHVSFAAHNLDPLSTSPKPHVNCTAHQATCQRRDITSHSSISWLEAEASINSIRSEVGYQPIVTPGLKFANAKSVNREAVEWQTLEADCVERGTPRAKLCPR